MKKKIRFTAALLALSCAVSMLTGCIGRSTDNMYALPQATEEYVQLQKIIDGIISGGAEYSAPSSGSHRQSVQLVDLNGNGVSEAIAFFRVPETRPLRIYIFSMADDSYENVAVIDGDGTAIDSINYADMDNDGVMELIVGWQMSAELRMLSVYSIKDFQTASLVLTDYTEYAVEDLDGDGASEVFVIRGGVSGSNGQVERYTLASDGEVVSSAAMLSGGMESISRVRSGGLEGGGKGLFVEGYYGGTSIITDVFACEEGTLLNISAGGSGVSTRTVRSYTVYSQDVNQDGVMDVPAPRELASQSDTIYWAIDWYNYSASGKREKQFTTFHNYSDGWYFEIPEEWGKNVTVRREDSVSGQRELVFSIWDSRKKTAEDFLEIYTVSSGKSGRDGRIEIFTDSSGVIYEARIPESNVDFQVTEETVRKNFHIIYNEWISGET